MEDEGEWEQRQNESKSQRKKQLVERFRLSLLHDSPARKFSFRSVQDKGMKSSDAG